MKDILELINAHPSINKINTNVKRSFMYKKDDCKYYNNIF